MPDVPPEVFRQIKIKQKVSLKVKRKEHRQMTQSEIQTLVNEQHTRILNAQNHLTATDYIAAKIAEGAASKEEYKTELELRQQWRNDINDAKAEIARLKAIEIKDNNINEKELENTEECY